MLKMSNTRKIFFLNYVYKAKVTGRLEEFWDDIAYFLFDEARRNHYVKTK